MKQRRWMKSVIAAAQSKDAAAIVLPWQRGTARQQMIVARHSTAKTKRSA